uniref:Uncharacterized protein n=1 Tax=Glossina pallidipes TaxID=7398 RepID=A0A1A9ZPJ4_GLOPL
MSSSFRESENLTEEKSYSSRTNSDYLPNRYYGAMNQKAVLPINMRQHAAKYMLLTPPMEKCAKIACKMQLRQNSHIPSKLQLQQPESIKILYEQREILAQLKSTDDTTQTTPQSKGSVTFQDISNLLLKIIELEWRKKTQRA